jgi:hypothetical protein
MAAVTQTTAPSRHVLGDLATRVFTFTGSSGDTLQTGMQQILHVSLSAGSLITAITQTMVAGIGVQLTFTSSGPMTAENIMVFARVG